MTSELRIRFDRVFRLYLIHPRIVLGIGGTEIEVGGRDRELVEVDAVRSPLLSQSLLVAPRSVPG